MFFIIFMLFLATFKIVVPSFNNGTIFKGIGDLSHHLFTHSSVEVKIDISALFFPIQWKSMGIETVWFPTFFKVYSFVFHQKQKVIQIWNYMKVRNNDTISF